jgi:hypothetical protein
MEDLVTVYKALLLDLPLTSVKWGLGLGKEKEVTEAAWRGYDAAVRLATAAVDNLYRTPLFGEAVARSLDSMLRWQRLSNALVGTWFAGLWPAVGLPTAAAVQGLRAEVQALREELHSSATDLLLAESLQANGKLATHPIVSLREELRSPIADLPVPSKKSGVRATDLYDYFELELVNADTTSPPGPEPRESEVRTTDLSAYFEPVDYGVKSAPGPEPRESKDGEVTTKLEAQTEVLQTGMQGTKHSPPPRPPRNRAGRRTVNKKAVKASISR